MKKRDKTVSYAVMDMIKKASTPEILKKRNDFLKSAGKTYDSIKKK